MTKLPWNVPEEDDLKIPRWARIALAARTVRRVQPLLLAAWPKAPAKFVRAVESALAEAELAAEQGAITPDQTVAGMKAMKAYGSRPMDVGAAGDVAYAAAHASFAARGADASRALFVIENAMWAVRFYEKRGATTLADAVLNAIWKDMRDLIKLAKAEKWNNKTPVSMDVFGPMWLDPPPGWPKIHGPPTRKKRPSGTTKPDIRKLGLPRDLIEFLNAGESLQYDEESTEVGLIGLKPLTHLRLGEFQVESEGTPEHAKDPHWGKDGYYVVKAVDLIGECDAYDPDGILAWLPDFRCYGCWDNDHHTALVFPKAKWSDIVADPAEYLDAQWNGPSDNAKYMTPWKHGKFKARK